MDREPSKCDSSAGEESAQPEAPPSTQPESCFGIGIEIDPKPKAPTIMTNTQNTSNETQKETLDAIKKGERLALIIAGIVALATIGQLFVTICNNASTSKQVNQIITAASQMASSADSFSRSAGHIKVGVDNAVGKLEAQRKTIERSGRAQVGQMESQLRTEERPIIILGPPQLFSTMRQTAPSAAQKGDLLYANLSYANVGRSAALRLRIARHMVFGLDALQNNYRLDDFPKAKDQIGADIGPQATAFFSVRGLKDTFQEGVDVGQADDIYLPWEGSTPMVFGAIVYFDRYNTMYCSPFFQADTDNPTIWMDLNGLKITTPTKTMTYNDNDLCPKGSTR